MEKKEKSGEKERRISEKRTKRRKGRKSEEIGKGMVIKREE